MKTPLNLYFAGFAVFYLFFASCTPPTPKNEWITLFNGKDLTGWTPSENPGSFWVEDGYLVANGERSHLFYTGKVAEGNFTNFEFQAQVMTMPLANSGIYFHTAFQEEGWPATGYEAQVNSTHIGGGDYIELKKTGSLYAVRNTYKRLVPDSVWYTYNIKVIWPRIQIRINDILVVDYLQPKTDSSNETRFPGQGTFALQGHDPGSTVYFKNIQVQLLDETTSEIPSPKPVSESLQKMWELQSQQYSFTDMGIEMNQSLDLQKALEFYYSTGINLGIVLDPQEYHQLESLRKYPVFVGARIVADSLDVARFDYVVANAGSFPAHSSLEASMEGYIESIVEDLTTKDIDIWSNATELPESLSSNYQTLWTPARMMRVIAAAIEKEVAIEIDNEMQLPGIEFIREAKEMGAKFTYSKLGVDSATAELDYIFKVIEECALNYKDIYIP